MLTTGALLQRLRTLEATRPRLTWYAPTGERVELSGKVLDNWVSKAANLLHEEFEVEPGSCVRVSLPGTHWRTFYWAVAVWASGATLLTDPAPAGAPDGPPADPIPVDVLVTTVPDEPGPGAGLGVTGASDPERGLVVVTLDMLARRHPGPVPAGAVDEARQLASYPDQFVPWQEPDPSELALLTPGGPAVRYADLIPPGRGGAGGTDAQRSPESPRRVLLPADTASGQALLEAVRTWADGGSVVVAPTTPSQLLDTVLRQEGLAAEQVPGPVSWRQQR